MPLEFVEKKHYSCFVDSKLLEKLNEKKIEEVYIVGINTNYCVLATALDAQSRGRFFTFVVKDAASSNTGKESHEEGIRNIVKFLGSKSIVTTEDVIKFEKS